MARTSTVSRTVTPQRRPRATEADRAIGAKVRLRRGEIGMSQTELGQKIGVTFQQVPKNEQGANRIGGSRLGAVASALGVPASYFFDPMPTLRKLPAGLRRCCTSAARSSFSRRMRGSGISASADR